MSTNDTFLAVFLGSKTGPKMAAWNALSEGERRAKEQQGMAAWHAWVDKHQGAIVAMGGPLGKTKKVDQVGVADIANQMGAFNLSGRIGRDHAGSADPRRLAGSAAPR
jgi:hypothetical protein